jgi:ribosomal protein S18 acetylase RimI-like enzyme
MPEIEVRRADSDDIEVLSAFEHGYYSEYVWQMSVEQDAHKSQAEFTRVHLPRRVLVTYPRKREEIFSDFSQAEAFLVAEISGQSVGYVKLVRENETNTARVTDLIISSSVRRQGIGSGLMVAVMNLVSHRGFNTLIMEMQSKNDPAIMMAIKLGMKFCGFRDHYFSNQELALFYSRFIR